jgi:hypothetical protein
MTRQHIQVTNSSVALFAKLAHGNAARGIDEPHPD